MTGEATSDALTARSARDDDVPERPIRAAGAARAVQREGSDAALAVRGTDHGTSGVDGERRVRTELFA